MIKKNRWSKNILEEIKQNELMRNNHKKVCWALSYFEHFLILISAVSGCVSILHFSF